MTHLKLFSTASAALLASLLFSSTGWSMGIRAPKDTAREPASTTQPPAPTPKPPAPTPKPPTTPNTSDFKALWEGKHADAANWTIYAREAVERYGDALQKGATDMDDFCPMYDRLGHRDQVNVWIQIIAAMTKFESGFKPTTQYTEDTMGIDPITGKQVVSEGLLQLSYQDERNYRKVLPAEVCDFDYEADSRLPKADPRRTILDAKTNLTCGIAILNRQLTRYGKISIDKGAYWSVLKPNGKRIAEIRSLVRALPICKN